MKTHIAKSAFHRGGAAIWIDGEGYRQFKRGEARQLMNQLIAFFARRPRRRSKGG